MRQEVVQFYEANRLSVDRLISVGRRKGLDENSIVLAAERLYDEIQEGREVKPIRMAWHIFSLSKRAKDTKADQEKKILEELATVKTLLLNNLPDRERAIVVVEDSIRSLNRSMNSRLDGLKNYANQDDFKELKVEIAELNKALVNATMPWYKRAWRWFNGRN